MNARRRTETTMPDFGIKCTSRSTPGNAGRQPDRRHAEPVLCSSWNPRDHDRRRPPCWASSAPTPRWPSAAPHAGAANAWPPSDPSRYAAFVAYLARRYGTKLAAIEVWNEPDQSNEHYSRAPTKPSATPRCCGRRTGDQGRRIQACRCWAARWWARTARSCGAVRERIKGYYDGLCGPLLHPHARLAALDPRSAAGQRRSTAPVAGRVRLEQLLAAGAVQQEQGCVTGAFRRVNLTDSCVRWRACPYVAAALSLQAAGA